MIHEDEPQPAYVPTKDDLLIAIDAAIGNLVTLRNYVNMAVAGTVSRSTMSPPSAAIDPHEGHKIVPGGFGEPDFCLTCDMEVGVSPEPGESGQA